MGNQVSKVRFILLEHHYDNMILKKYTFSEINNYLISYNFEKVYKAKMPFRKTFEYIYVNKAKTNMQLSNKA